IKNIAIDAPSGLPTSGAPRREADVRVNAPTRRMPNHADELERGVYRDGKQVAYIAVIRLGLHLFGAHRDALWDGREPHPRLVETYPRAILLRLLEHLHLPPRVPSKRKD